MYQNTIHHQHINRAINYAEEFCGDEIDLGAMADVACLSKFHFLRIFKESVGETPFSFLQRIRLERAARELVFLRNAPVIDIAFDCGFGSAQSFSSAFHKRFGTAPTKFRKSNVFEFRSYLPKSNLPEAHSPQRLLRFDTILKQSSVRVEERVPNRVAYIRRIGPYKSSGGIGRIFEVLRQWARRQGLLMVNTEIIGIPWDNPNVTRPANCRYDVCIQVPESVRGDDLVAIQTIPGGTYAVMPVDEEMVNIRYAWEVFTQNWLQSSNYVTDFRAGYEVCGPSRDGREHFCSSLWLPVRPKQAIVAH